MTRAIFPYLSTFWLSIAMIRYNNTYVPSKSSSSYSNNDESVHVTADGLLMNTFETLFPAEIDGAQEPIGEECLDLDPKRDDA